MTELCKPACSFGNNSAAEAPLRTNVVILWPSIVPVLSRTGEAQAISPSGMGRAQKPFSPRMALLVSARRTFHCLSWQRISFLTAVLSLLFLPFPAPLQLSGHPNALSVTASVTPCGLCVPRCPVMAGGLFSIDKKYFSELGMYDPGLDVWGGENMEISFKVGGCHTAAPLPACVGDGAQAGAPQGLLHLPGQLSCRPPSAVSVSDLCSQVWMCGGEIEIVPCSRVGHIFRNDNPYSFPKDRVRTVERNLARVAEVWLDEYKELFYGHAYHLLHSVDVGDLSQQIQLRQRLRCKTFRWYLQNVYPDLEAPLVKASGQLVNVALAGCIAVEGTSLAFEECDANSTNQKFNYTWLRLIQHGELCLAPAGVLGAVGLRQCQGRSRSLAWLHGSLATVQPGLVSDAAAPSSSDGRGDRVPCAARAGE
uniref:Uncharacterized protein n=1 Tax=Geospiza parvula TaxID=87175 RepID=A0A8C3N5N6_GEOPR